MSRSYPPEATIDGEDIRCLRSLSDSLIELWYECKEKHDENYLVKDWYFERKFFELEQKIIDITDQIEMLDDDVVGKYEHKLFQEFTDSAKKADLTEHNEEQNDECTSPQNT